MRDKKITSTIREMRQLMYRGKRTGINSSAAMIIWGVIALIAMELTPMFFLNGWFTTISGSVVATVVFHLFIFSLGLFLDRSLTMRKIEELGEILDYTSEQISKVWIFVLGFGIYLTVVMAVTGGRYFIYPAWMILVGAGMYFCGLFSLKYYERYGLLLLAAGIICTFVPGEYAFIVGKRTAEAMVGMGLIISGIYTKRRYGW
jgi:hypothetical protein